MTDFQPSAGPRIAALLRRALFGPDRRLRPGWVIAVFVVAASALYFGAQLLLWRLAPVRPPLRLDHPALALPSLAGLVAAGVGTLAATVAGRRPKGEWLVGPGFLRRAGLGVALGALAILVVGTAPVLLGQVSFAIGPAPSLEALVTGGARVLAVLLPAALAEELALRGVVLRELSRTVRPGAAVAFSSAAFGALHLGNPHASTTAAINVALVGSWFAVLAVRSGSVWTPTGAHLAWNLGEGFVFGFPVSGILPGRSLLRPLSGSPTFFSGGGFGPEAAGFTTAVLCVLLAATVAWPRNPVARP